MGQTQVTFWTLAAIVYVWAAGMFHEYFRAGIVPGPPLKRWQAAGLEAVVLIWATLWPLYWAITAVCRPRPRNTRRPPNAPQRPFTTQ